MYLVRLVLIDFPKNPDQLFIVLLGRYYGYKILSIKKIDKSLENSIKKELKSSQHHLFLVEIIPALVLKEEYDFLNLIGSNDLSIYYSYAGLKDISCLSGLSNFNQSLSLSLYFR